MRRISFAKTKRQFKDRSKDVTRRIGWLFAKPGMRLLGVSKVMGFKPGEVAEEFGVIEVVSVRREPLNAITKEDVAREGFPGKSPEWFVDMFMREIKNAKMPHMTVTRIEFRYVDPWP